MKKISLLSISNSFGVNLQTFPSQIASENGRELDIFVLYIGGCSLETHCKNIDENGHNYVLYHNGKWEKENVSILDALTMQKYDYIITQQVSYLAPQYDSYFPFLTKLLNYIKTYGNYDKLGLQETWEYSTRFKKNDNEYFTQKDSDKMYEKLQKTYKRIAKENDLILFRSGDVIHEANKKFNKQFQCDDGFHLNDEGCYLIGLNLIKQLFNIEIKKNLQLEGSNKDDLNSYLNFINSFQ